MTGRHDSVKDGVADAWIGWLHQHDVSVPETIRAAVKDAVTEWLNQHGDVVITAAIAAAVARELPDLKPAEAPQSRRRIVTPALLKEVAEVYRAAHVAGNPPTVAVAEHFSTSHRNAARWVGEARKAGILGPAHGTKPGEVGEVALDDDERPCGLCGCSCEVWSTGTGADGELIPLPVCFDAIDGVTPEEARAWMETSGGRRHPAFKDGAV